MPDNFNLTKKVTSEIIEWIGKHIDQPLQIEDIASRSGYSRWHIQRMFKKHTSKTLGAYIRERKLIAAAMALATTDETVIDVSFRFGFESQQGFTRQFTRYFSIPPAQWRREGANRWPNFTADYPASVCNIEYPVR